MRTAFWNHTRHQKKGRKKTKLLLQPCGYEAPRHGNRWVEIGNRTTELYCQVPRRKP